MAAELSGKKAVIIGAGPAGLTAARELLLRTGIKPVIFEADNCVGGISRTVEYKGNRIDIGGHRFFSKSDRVKRWWLDILKLQCSPARDDKALNRRLFEEKSGCSGDPEKEDAVLLVRPRVSRIFFGRKFFDYPLSLSLSTFKKLGFARLLRVGFSYVRSVLFPIAPEKSLEDFYINRFGRELYDTFFRDYTEKLWGIKCSGIKPDWGAQRVKGLSIFGVITHALRKALGGEDSKKVETSLIERFMYPKFGPGQLWQAVADDVVARGGEVYLHHKVVGVNVEGEHVVSVTVLNEADGKTFIVRGDYFFSTMPVKDLIVAINIQDIPSNVKEVAEGLIYRDFITAGLLLNRLKVCNEGSSPTVNNIIPDTWIYVQEKDVKMGRIQVYNNWSPYLVKDDGKIWLGLEFFCNEGDSFWNKSDSEIAELAAEELCRVGFIDKDDVIDSTVVRSRKTYPAYFGSFDRFGEIKDFTDGIGNLYLVGRNGMHRYNNMDHSMLSAMIAVDNIASGVKDKSNIWEVNTEKEYYEEK